MADIKWIKLTTDMFDNRKIKHLRRLPDGNNIVLIWIYLLTMAGRCNAGGMIFLTENIPYTTKMLADEIDLEETTVALALQALSEMQMIVCNEKMLMIANWEEYQNVDRLNEIREYNRLAKQKSRAKQKLLKGVNDKSMTSQPCHDTDIDKEEDIDIDKRNKKATPCYFPEYPEVDKTFKAYIQMRKDIKAKMTDHAIELALDKLNDMATEHGNFNPDVAIQILNNSIMNSWKGIFPLKTKKEESKDINRSESYDDELMRNLLLKSEE